MCAIMQKFLICFIPHLMSIWLSVSHGVMQELNYQISIIYILHFNSPSRQRLMLIKCGIHLIRKRVPQRTEPMIIHLEEGLAISGIATLLAFHEMHTDNNSVATR